MQKLHLSIVLFIIFITASTATFADTTLPEGWYVSGSAGAYMRETQNGSTTITHYTSTTPPVSAPGTQHEPFDAGEAFNLAFGRQLNSHLRLEVEAGYDHYAPDHINPKTTAFPNIDGRTYNLSSGGDYSRYTGTINGFYDIITYHSITPYIGTGAGYAYSDSSTAIFYSANGIKFTQNGGSANHAIVLAEGGVSFDLGDSFALVPAYRYVHYLINPIPLAREELALMGC